MTPVQILKRAIVRLAIETDWFDESDEFSVSDNLRTEASVDEAWEAFTEIDEHFDLLSEFREGEVETGICDGCSRHYESRGVAAKIEGKWIGRTYWYGGGKHGQPEEIEWYEEAFELNCVEREQTVTNREFSRVTAD